MPTTTRIRAALSDVLLRSLKPPSEGRIELFDTVAPGLEARLTAHGVLSFSTVVRTRDGERPRLTLGRYLADVTLAEARRWVRQQRAAVRLGINPAAEQRAARTAQAEQDPDPTVAARLAQWQAEQPRPWKDRYRVEVARVVQRIINPALGTRVLADVTRGDWMQMIGDVRTKGTPNGRRLAGTDQVVRTPSPAQATTTYTVVSSFLTYAENVGWITQNPLPRRGKALAAPDGPRGNAP